MEILIFKIFKFLLFLCLKKGKQFKKQLFMKKTYNPTIIKPSLKFERMKILY